MYNEEKLYSVRSLVAVHILNFQRDLVVMRFIRIELIICSNSKEDRDKVHNVATNIRRQTSSPGSLQQNTEQLFCRIAVKEIQRTIQRAFT